MKRMRAISSAILAGAVVAGCCFGPRSGPVSATAAASAQAPLADSAFVPIEKIPFHTGVSSATVEKLAKQQGCTGGQGAGLITEAGPVEVYRMQCDSGKMFMARCELRQCMKM